MNQNKDELGRGIDNYRGTRDHFGNEARWRNMVTREIRNAFEAFGFEPLETPDIENERTLAGKYGQEGEMRRFRLTLKPPEEAGLRYDHTVPLARFMAMRWNEFPLPYRRYIVGPVFRHEAVQAGRLRQFTQCDFDTVGSTSPVIDAEVVALNCMILNRLGFAGNFTVRVNDRRLLNAMAMSIGLIKPEQAFAAFRGWDKIEKSLLPSVLGELVDTGIDPKRISRFGEVTEKLQMLGDLSADRVLTGVAETFPSAGVANALRSLEKLVGFIDSMGVSETNVQVYPLLARGLDYYTGPIFEVVVSTAGIGSIAGGGRYDNLIALMGGPNLPACGSSFGLERVMEVMGQLGLKPDSTQNTQVFMTLFDLDDPALCQETFRLAANLRELGHNVEVYTGEKAKLGKQLDYANRRKIPLATILGPDELCQGSVTFKDLRPVKGITNGQVTIPVEAAAGQIAALLDKSLE